ncbi:uncharacterized protein LOC144223454 [Crocuta crocuta]
MLLRQTAQQVLQLGTEEDGIYNYKGAPGAVEEKAKVAPASLPPRELQRASKLESNQMPAPRVEAAARAQGLGCRFAVSAWDPALTADPELAVEVKTFYESDLVLLLYG